MAKGITTEKIYDLINEVRRELKADITAVDGKVDGLAAQLGNVKVEQATIGAKVYMIFGIFTLVISTITTAVVSSIIDTFRR